jgi:hypothetical protein
MSASDPTLDALAETFFACDAEYRLCRLEDRDEDEVQERCDRWDNALDAVVEAKTVTRQDIVTKARVLALAMELEVPQFLRETIESSGSPYELLAYSICQDLARLG